MNRSSRARGSAFLSRPASAVQLTISEPARARHLSVALLTVAALTGACPSRPGGNDNGNGTTSPPIAPFRIAMIAKSASNPSFLASRLGAENRARALSAELGRPIEIEWLTPPREDAALQVQRIRQAVSERFDAVLLSCSDVATVTPAIDDAVAHGVPVMTFDSDAPSSRRFATCGVDDFKAGQSVMRELAQLIPHHGKVAILAGNPSAPNLRRRVEGVMSEAAHHAGLTVLGPFFHDETPQDATAAVMRAEAAHPDIAGWAMVGGWPLYTQTLLHEIESGTPKLLVPTIVSINAIPPQLLYVDKGLAPVLLAQPTYLWGEVGVDTIVDKLLRKQSVPQRIPMELVRVTRANLGAWVRQLRAWGFVDAPEEYLQRP
jgi:ribose transport system substrate-binding protein